MGRHISVDWAKVQYMAEEELIPYGYCCQCGIRLDAGEFASYCGTMYDTCLVRLIAR